MNQQLDIYLKIIKKFAEENNLELEIIPRTYCKFEEEYYSNMINGFVFQSRKIIQIAIIL